jgi:hypothetical protein
LLARVKFEIIPDSTKKNRRRAWNPVRPITGNRMGVGKHATTTAQIRFLWTPAGNQSFCDR